MIRTVLNKENVTEKKSNLYASKDIIKIAKRQPI